MMESEKMGKTHDHPQVAAGPVAEIHLGMYIECNLYFNFFIVT